VIQTTSVSFRNNDFRSAAHAFFYSAAWRGCTHAGYCLNEWTTNGNSSPKHFIDVVIDAWEYHTPQPEKRDTRVSFIYPPFLGWWTSSMGTRIEVRHREPGETALFITGHPEAVTKRLNAIPGFLLERVGLIDKSRPPVDCPPDCLKCAAQAALNRP